MKIVSFLIFCLLPFPTTAGSDRSLARDSGSPTHAHSAAIQRPWDLPIRGEPVGPGLIATLRDEEEEDSLDEFFFDDVFSRVSLWESLRRADSCSVAWAPPVFLPPLSCPIPLRC